MGGTPEGLPGQDDPGRNDVDLQGQEIRIRGKGGKTRYGASARAARVHRAYDRIMDDSP